MATGDELYNVRSPNVYVCTRIYSTSSVRRVLTLGARFDDPTTRVNEISLAIICNGNNKHRNYMLDVLHARKCTLIKKTAMDQ